MSRWRLAGLGLGIYALGLIALAPASLVDSGLQQASQGRVRLADARGTLWSGAGQLEARDWLDQTAIARSFTWRVRPVYFLRGQLRAEVVLDQAAKPFPLTISLSQIEVAAVDLALPAAALGLAEPKLAPLGLTGDARLHITRLVLGRDNIEGSAVLQWRGAGSAYTPISPLGDYELRFDAEGGSVRASLSTLQGPLQLSGQGSWSRGARPAFQGAARIAPEHRAQLAPLMRMIAVDRGEGNFDLQLK